MNISLLSKLWPLSSKQSLNDYTIKWYWKFRYSLLARKTFFPSVKYLQEKQFWLGEVHGETEEKKKFCCYLKKNFFLFLSQSFANWKKRWLKSLIREQCKIWHKKTQIKSICDKNFSKELKKKVFWIFIETK